MIEMFAIVERSKLFEIAEANMYIIDNIFQEVGKITKEKVNFSRAELLANIQKTQDEKIIEGLKTIRENNIKKFIIIQTFLETLISSEEMADPNAT